MFVEAYEILLSGITHLCNYILQVSYHKDMFVLCHSYQYIRGKLADRRIVFFLPQCLFRCKSVAILTHKKV